MSTGEGRRIFTDFRFNLDTVVWQPDSRGFYAVNKSTTHPKYLNTYLTEVWHFDLSSGQETPVPLEWERGLAKIPVGETGFEGRIAAMPDGFLAVLADGARVRTARYTRSGERWQRTFLEGPHATNIFGLRGGAALGMERVA